MKTISQFAEAYAASHEYSVADVQEHAQQLDAFAKDQGYTITVTPPLTVAAWRIEMQRVCRVLLDIGMVDASGLTEHEYAHNAKLRQLWQDKADILRAAYPAYQHAVPVRNVERERAIMRAGVAYGREAVGEDPLYLQTALVDSLLEKVQP